MPPGKPVERPLNHGGQFRFLFHTRDEPRRPSNLASNDAYIPVIEIDNANFIDTQLYKKATDNFIWHDFISINSI